MIKKKKVLPHENVYTRFGISKIHGVGVFAIIDIPINTSIFSNDKSEMVWFNEEELELQKLSEEFKNLYKDFCVILKKGDSKVYGCPDNFTNLTISWYLNHSKTPNVYCDQEYNFLTLRDIKAGEELTVDYDTYSDE
jgi:SET domain-containing protein